MWHGELWHGRRGERGRAADSARVGGCLHVMWSMGLRLGSYLYVCMKGWDSEKQAVGRMQGCLLCVIARCTR